MAVPSLDRFTIGPVSGSGWPVPYEIPAGCPPARFARPRCPCWSSFVAAQLMTITPPADGRDGPAGDPETDPHGRLSRS
jgi:hypothetical protein